MAWGDYNYAAEQKKYEERRKARLEDLQKKEKQRREEVRKKKVEVKQRLAKKRRDEERYQEDLQRQQQYLAELGLTGGANASGGGEGTCIPALSRGLGGAHVPSQANRQSGSSLSPFGSGSQKGGGKGGSGLNPMTNAKCGGQKDGFASGANPTSGGGAGG